MAPEALFGESGGGGIAPGEGAQETARNGSKLLEPLEPAKTAEDPPLRTPRCRPTRAERRSRARRRLSG
eukprot:2830291-Alexandrium_andersonii.AAC.1